jgi:hypothetical protein
MFDIKSVPDCLQTGNFMQAQALACACTGGTPVPPVLTAWQATWY